MKNNILFLLTVLTIFSCTGTAEYSTLKQPVSLNNLNYIKPDIAGKNIANPLALILSSELMMRYLGEDHVANHIKHAVIVLLSEHKYLTPDLGGTATTTELTNALIREIVH